MSNLRVVVVGDKSVGKTALISRMSGQPFASSYQETLGVDLKCLMRGDTRLQIWDLAGDQRFQRIADANIRGANIALLCLDFSRADVADKFAAYLDRLVEASPDVRVIVVGTKVDEANLVDMDVSSELSQRIASAECLFGHPIQTSAKNGTGIDALKEAMFEIALLFSPQKPHEANSTEVAEDDDVQETKHAVTFPQEPFDENVCSAGFFFQVAQHPATGVIGGLLMLAGLIALGIGIACLCPALVPVMAGIGIALSESVATSVAIAGGCATVVGTMATFFHKHATDTSTTSH